MSKEITRFCPTIHNGPMHIGHIYNYLANMFYAKRYNGNCYFSPERAFFLGPNRLVEQTIENMKIAENFCMPNGRNVCMPLMFNTLNYSYAQTSYVRYILEQLKIIPKSDDKNDNFCNGENCEIAINDFIMGVTTIIRGRDLSEKYQKDIYSVFPQEKHEMWLNYLNKKGEKDINVKKYFHPLITYNNDKISKSGITIGNNILKNIMIKTYSFIYTNLWITGDNNMLESGDEVEKDKIEVLDYVNEKSLKVMPASIVLYIIELMSERKFCCTQDAYNYYKEFDIEEICSKENYEYNIDDLLLTDYRLREMLCKEKGINRNDILIIKEEREFMHGVISFEKKDGKREYSGAF